MKGFFAFAVTVATLSVCTAQDVPEPDFSQRPYHLSEGKLYGFEKVDAMLDHKIKGMGYGGLEYYCSANGTKSSVRFTQSTLPKIIIKMEDNSDPSESFLLCAGEIKKSSRRFKTMKFGTLGNMKESGNRIKLTVKKLRDKVFEVSIGQPIPAGEYALIPYSNDATQKATTTGIGIFCFGVDQ